MKNAILTAFLLGAAASAAAAQPSGKAVVGTGSAPTADYVWATLRGANAVDVRQTSGALVVQLAGPVFSFNQPWDIVGVPSLRKVFVSNRGANPGTVTVIDADTLQFVQLVTIPGSLELRGMSVDADEGLVYIAGQDAQGPSVFHIDTSSLAAGRSGGVTDVGRGAEDCSVIRAGNAGGTGNGPGKIYFSVRAGVPTGYIGEINVLAGGAFSSADVGIAPIPEVNLPDLMERTVDHRFVFIGCTKIIGTDTVMYVLRINPLVEPLSSALTVQPIVTGIQDLNHRIFDVTWAVDGVGNNRGFVLSSLDAGTPQIREIDQNGAQAPVPPLNANTGGVTPATVRYQLNSERVFVGEVFGTSNTFNIFNAKLPPPVIFQNSQLATGNDPFNFVVMSTPACVISDICPRAGLSAASLLVTVHGSGFQPTSTYGVGAGAVPITAFIDTNTIIVDLGGAGAASLNLQVNNPNFQTGLIDTFFRRYTPEVRNPFSIALPPVSGGYRMLSVPQYTTLTALRAALAGSLGPYNPVLYRVFFYRNGGYVELNTMADDGCDLAGESFWIITRNGGTLTVSEPDVLANAGGSPRVIPLNPGFNMFSQPNMSGSGSMIWNNVLVGTDPTNFGTAVSVGGGTIVGPALEFSGGGYVVADPIVAGRGYWVMNLTTGPAYLVFDPGLVFKAGAPSMAAGGPPPAG
ncbi:MAG: IPT/TIG domain-containing protein, partial [Planctomycetes bacterium]|nr:IPT/TIG domain-containing protein [Planctomycetota bacterium]